MTSPESQPVLLSKRREPFEHLLSRESSAAFLDDPPDGFEERRLDDGCKRAAGPDPHVGRVRNALLLQLEGDPVVDVVSNVLLVGQHLVDSAARPGPPEIGQRAFIVQDGGDFAFGPTFVDEHSVHAPNGFDLVIGPGYQDDAVGLEALLSCRARARPSVAAVRR